MTPREVPLGGPRAMTVRRTLPQRQPFADRRLVLPRPLRSGRRGRDRRMVVRAAPAHRAADRELAVHRRDRAPRQRRQRRDGAPRRAQPDDRGPRDQPLRDLDCRPRRRCTARSCGWPCPTRTGDTDPGFEHYAPDRGRRRRLARPGLPRVAARRHLAGGHVHPAARRGGRARPRHPPRPRGRRDLRARRARRPRHARGRRRPAMPSRATSPTSRRRRQPRAHRRRRRVRGSSCSAGRRSARRS